MTDIDKELIDQANGISYIDWFCIESLIEKAESKEAKDRLNCLMVLKYHQEEYSSR